MDFKKVLGFLERGMQHPLPGKEAHLQMSPNPVDMRRFDPKLPENYRKGAVLILFYPENEKAYFPLIKRPEYPGFHSGQISFPGGKMDPEDRDVAATALREAYEEVGLDPDSVDVLGVLPIYTTGSAFLVSPVVALLRPDMPLRANANEVASIFEVPLSFLMNPANHRRHAYERNGVQREWLSMPYVEGSQERFIWGATAGMLRNLYRFLVA